jgi:hypothetical protein
MKLLPGRSKTSELRGAIVGGQGEGDTSARVSLLRFQTSLKEPLTRGIMKYIAVLTISGDAAMVLSWRSRKR